MTFAPRMRASWRANAPTPPVAPNTSTVVRSPGATTSTALIAVVPATASEPASTSLSPSGALATETADGGAGPPNAPGRHGALLPLRAGEQAPTAIGDPA